MTDPKFIEAVKTAAQCQADVESAERELLRARSALWTAETKLTSYATRFPVTLRVDGSYVTVTAQRRTPNYGRPVFTYIVAPAL